MRQQTLDTRQRIFRLPVFFGLSVFLTFGLLSCKKEKLDFNNDNRLVTDAMSVSNVRIVNFAEHNQALLNGDTITNYLVYDPQAPGMHIYPPTRYFAKDGRLGSVWNVQQEVFDNNGKAHLFTEAASYGGVLSSSLEFDIREELEHPKDYYLLNMVPYEGFDRVQPLPRDITGPTRPDHFKIRLVNFASPITIQTGGEDLTGSISLTYADGTPVKAATNDIAPGDYSDYIELPYGTYQFRVLTQDGRQIPATGGNRLENTFTIDPATSSLTTGPNRSAGYLTFAPILSYQPGSIYTLVVAPNQYTIPYGKEDVNMYQNGVTLITDLAPPINTAFARMQVVNALPGVETISLRVRNDVEQPIAHYGTGSDYISLATGTYPAEIRSGDGTVLVTSEINARANQNYSLWLYSGENGTPTVALVTNGMSGYYYSDREDSQDASLNRYRMRHPFKMRFLNLCPDESYVTFTDANGQRFQSNPSMPYPTSAVESIGFGAVPVESPYILWNPQQVMAYESLPGTVPGTWLNAVPVLSSQDFISRRELYDVRGQLPTYEPGIYTVALIGRNQAGTTPEQQAKMIIIKHNK